jgi:hypothetical protein
MKKTCFAITLAILTACSAYAQNIVGDWQGTLKAGPSELRLLLHVSKKADGSFQGTMDSIDQASYGLTLSTILLKEGKLNFTVDIVHGTYDGKVNADGNQITGTWSQGQPFPLDFTRATKPIKTEHKPAKPSDIDGGWWGTLDTGTAKLRLVFHITNTEDGLTATLDSLDQDVKGLPVTSVTRDGTSILLEMKQLAGVFDGKIDKDRTSMDGTWTQAGHTWPLVLKRAKDSSEMERRHPQNPVKPYPHRDEEVSFENTAAKISLAGTMTIPAGKGPFPAVVLRWPR